jgi:hypothetical protein
MSDHDLDDVFAAYRAGGPLVTAAGPQAARAVARRRRTARVVLLSVLGVALAATSALAAVRPDRERPGPPVNTATPGPAPSATAPSVTAPTSAPASPPPDGRISAQQLGNATLTLPAWPADLDDSCPDGRVRFSGGRARLAGVVEYRVDISQVVHADLDGDSAPETAALISCHGMEMSETRVLGFDRDAAGTIRTMGIIAEAPAGDVAGIRDIRTATGGVEVEVTDFAGDGIADDLPQRQWRRYAWSGRRFGQTGGPTAFPPNPRITDLSVSGVDHMLAPVEGDRSAGTMRLTVENHGPHRAAAPTVRVYLPSPFQVRTVPAGCTPFQTVKGTNYTCRLPALRVGGTDTIDLPVTVPRSQVDSGVAGQYTAEVFWRAGTDWFYPEPPGAKANNSFEADLIVTG